MKTRFQIIFKQDGKHFFNFTNLGNQKVLIIA